MKKNLLLLLLFFIPCFAIAALEQLVVGTASGYAPYVSLNAKGEYEGLDIDLAKALAQKLQKNLVIRDFGTMPSLLLALKQNKADFLLWAISITKERLEKMEMVYYQGEAVTDMPLLFWDSVPEGISTLEDLAQYSKRTPKSSLCIESGSYQESILSKIPHLHLKYVATVTDALLEIQYGKSFATTIDPSLISRLVLKQPDIKVIRLPLPLQEQILGHGICINKNNQELAKQVRLAIGELTSEGVIAELEKKWLSQP